MENVKIRIAVLWVLMAVFMSAHTVIAFAEPGMIEQTISGEIFQGMDPAQMLFMMSLFWLIPLWMAFLTVTLNGSVNRWLNIIVGAVLTALNIWHITEPCCEMVHQKLIVGSTILVTALVAWYAYRWQED